MKTKISTLLSEYFGGSISNNIHFIIGYGSGVFPQKTNDNKTHNLTNQVDLIVVVNSSAQFHHHNY